MGLTQAYLSTRIVEAASNYAKADEPIPDGASTTVDRANTEPLYSDDHFWGTLFNNPDAYWDKSFETNGSFVFSEWVARVPGMFWHPDSRRFQELASKGVSEELPSGLRVYPPHQKTPFVMGGTGTLRLPPDHLGRRLGTISSMKNASVGIPVIIYPEVWDHHALKEGAPVDGVFQWKKMDHQWSQHFLSTRNIVRGYLEIRHPDHMKTYDDISQIMVHPFSIMEYERDSLKLYDFMFFTMDQGTDRAAMKSFLTAYAEKHGHASYLLESDINVPVFDGVFSDPAQFRAEGKEHLDFMNTRLNEILNGNTFQEEILNILTTKYLPDDLRAVSGRINIPAALWDIGGSMSDRAVAFLNEVNDKAKTHELIEAIERDHPDSINA